MHTTLDLPTSTPPGDAGVPGDRIGPYRLLSLLGRGGMGEVFKAVHVTTERVVALKIIRFRQAQLKTHIERMTQEAMAMAALRHPHVVTCYSLGEDQNLLYLALELMSGGDTVGLVKRRGGGLDEASIRSLANACASGLRAIHQAGLVHRDIKPSNILLDGEGCPKLADFGLAWFIEPLPGSSIRVEGGTPSFMPPEVITRDCPPDICGDLYSLGVTMHYWATGMVPFRAETPLLTLAKVLKGDAPDLQTLRPDLSAELRLLIAKAMHRDHAQRFQDPEEFLAGLSGTSTPPASASASPAPPPRPGDLRRAWLFRVLRSRPSLIAASLGIASLLVLLLGVGKGRHAPTVAAEELGPGPAAALGAGYQLHWLGDALVLFRENGEVVYTRSGQRIRLGDEGWLEGSGAQPLVKAMAASGDLSIELVLRPANLTQQGPAQIFCIGLTPRSLDLLIGQSGTRVEVRVRTTVTNPDGTRPHLISEEGVLSQAWQHLIVIRRGSHQALYVNGRRCGEAEVPGDLSTWDASYPITVGNVHRGGLPWSGSLDRVVLGARAWSEAEIAAIYQTWRSENAGQSAPEASPSALP